MVDARIRANWTKFSIGCIKRLEPHARDAVLDGLDAETRERIRQAAPLEWLPAESFLEVTRAVYEALGSADAAGYWRRNLSQSVEQPFLRPLVEGGLFLFGRTPASLVRRTPQAWKLVARECGRWEVDDDEEQRWATVDQYELPRAFRGHAGWARVIEGGAGALLDVVGCRGGVVLDTSHYAVGHLGARLEWR